MTSRGAERTVHAVPLRIAEILHEETKSASRPAMSKKIGRPPVLSKDMILDAALGVVAADPMAALSMTGLARHLNVTPMAIYGYFANRDDLMQAMSRRLLEGLAFDNLDLTNPGGAFQEWAHTVRRHFLAHPELINMLTWDDGHSSIAWLNSSDRLFQTLVAMGLDEGSLPVATLSIWNCVMSAIKFEIYERDSRAKMSDDEYDGLDTAVIEPVGKVRAFLEGADAHEQLFVFQIDMLTAHLERIGVSDAEDDYPRSAMSASR